MASDATTERAVARRGERSGAGAPRPLLVLGAVESELTALRRSFRSVEKREDDDTVAERGWLGGRETILVVTGPGRLDAVAGAAWGLDWGGGARAVVSAGFCSGLRADLAYGDVFVPDAVDEEADAVERQSGRRPPPPPPLRPDPVLARLATREAERLGARVRTGTLVTVAAALRHAEAKRTLAALTGAAAADGETAAYGPAVRGWSAPLVVVRVVLDGPGETPASPEELGYYDEGRSGRRRRKRRRRGRGDDGVVGRAVRYAVSAARDLLGLPAAASRVPGAAELLAQVVLRLATVL
ncbi:MAG TPA: hypothetical protein VG389_20675 [Myxococcota bacterium]|jgi:adenosylhomocysteine nucleosidase|nr:hypothetical protein [Myxococcota bacterium]